MAGKLHIGGVKTTENPSDIIPACPHAPSTRTVSQINFTPKTATSSLDQQPHPQNQHQYKSLHTQTAPSHSSSTERLKLIHKHRRDQHTTIQHLHRPTHNAARTYTTGNTPTHVYHQHTDAHHDANTGLVIPQQPHTLHHVKMLKRPTAESRRA